MPDHRKNVLALQRELSRLAEAEFGRDARAQPNESALRYCQRILLLMKDGSAAPGGQIGPGETIARTMESTQAVPTSKLSVVVHALRNYLVNLAVEKVERQQNLERGAWAKVIDAMEEGIERSSEAAVGRDAIESERGRHEFIRLMSDALELATVHFPKDQRVPEKTLKRSSEERARLTIRQLRLALAGTYSHAEIADLVDDGIEGDRFKAAGRVRQERNAARGKTRRRKGSDQNISDDPNQQGKEWVVVIP